MEKSCAYKTEVIPVPPDLRAWVSRTSFKQDLLFTCHFAICQASTLPQREAGFEWANDEEKVGLVSAASTFTGY